MVILALRSSLGFGIIMSQSGQQVLKESWKIILPKIINVEYYSNLDCDNIY